MGAARIGCTNLVYAPVNTDDGTDFLCGTITSLPGVTSVTIDPNSSSATLFADDGPMEIASTIGKIDVEINKNELTLTQKAALLGHTMDGNGGMLSKKTATPPWVAIGFKTLKSNGSYRYVWLFKGKFIEPTLEAETKGESVSFQPDKIVGSFVARELDGSWKYEQDEDETNAPVDLGTTFFDKVQGDTVVV